MTDPHPADPLLTRATLLMRLRPDAPAREVAWREFYDRYAPIISGFARKMGASPQDNGDLVQDVLLGFFAASPEFEYNPSLGRFRGYLKACTWRAFKRRFNQRLRFGGRSLDTIDAGELQIEAVWNDIWESEKLQRALELVRQRYLSRPDRAKTYRAFEMCALIEREPAEVAVELGMSVDGVHQAKTRISKALRAAMEELEDFVV